MLTVQPKLCLALVVSSIVCFGGSTTQAFTLIPWTRWLTACATVSSICLYSLHKQSLTAAGILAASVIGLLVALVSYPLLLALTAFLLIGSKATKLGAARKAETDAQYNPLGRRQTSQVIANGAAVASVAYMHATYPSVPLLCGACAIACALGDTLASELGPLLDKAESVRLITRPGVRVPTGTNGGVTLAGFTVAALGGVIIGLVYGVTSGDTHLLQTVSICALAGLYGCAIDSVLGEHLQETRTDITKPHVITTETDTVKSKHASGRALIDGDMVNLISTFVTAATFYCFLS